MPDTFTGSALCEDPHWNDTHCWVCGALLSVVPPSFKDTERLLSEIQRVREELVRCLAFIRTIPDDMRAPAVDGWRKELRAIKREIHA